MSLDFIEEKRNYNLILKKVSSKNLFLVASQKFSDPFLGLYYFLDHINL